MVRPGHGFVLLAIAAGVALVGLEAGDSRLRPGSGPGQLRRILRALAWAGYEDQRQDREEREESAA